MRRAGTTTTWELRTATMTMSRTIPRGKRRGGDPAVKDGNDNNDEDDLMDVMGVLPPLVARRVEHLKCLNTERERVMEQYLEERTALETKYSDLCKPLYEERGNVVAGCLYDEIEMIHKEGGGEKEEEVMKRYDDNGDDDAGGREEREVAASLEDASDNDKCAAPSPPEVLLILTSNPQRMTIMKRVAW